MFPILFQWGSITLYAYGFLIGVGLIVGIHLMERFADDERHKVVVRRFVIPALLAGMIGSRILQVIVEWDHFSQNPGDIVRFWESRAFIGGPIFGVPIVLLIYKWHQLNLWKASDLGTIILMAGHGFGRIGCFFAGCCYGKATTSWLGVKFPDQVLSPELRGLLVHPTQAYEALYVLALLGVLLFFYRKRAFDGQLALTYFLMYPVARFFMEYLRGDDQERGFVIPDLLSTSQLVSIILVLVAGSLSVYRYRQVRRQAQTDHQNRPTKKSKKSTAA